MEKLSRLADWIKSNPLIVLVGALTPIIGFLLSVSNFMPVILKALNRPSCYTYGDIYRDNYTEFRREGAFWNEYARDTQQAIYQFREDRRDPDFILLINLTDRTNSMPPIPNWKNLRVRLPVCPPGKAQIVDGVGLPWRDLYDVWRP
jgi:hypothetical protein